MPLPIIRIGAPVLRCRCKAVKSAQWRHPRFHELLHQMVLSMRQAEGVGLAANQVGVDLNAMVLECRSNKRYLMKGDFPLEIFFNLRIVKYSRRFVSDWEGCLSIPEYRGLVPRAARVTFEAMTPDGCRVRRTVSGFHARVIQHECDHLNGLVYLDRMKGMKTLMHLDEFNKVFSARIKDMKKSKK